LSRQPPLTTRPAPALLPTSPAHSRLLRTLQCARHQDLAKSQRNVSLAFNRNTLAKYFHSLLLYKSPRMHVSALQLHFNSTAFAYNHLRRAKSHNGLNSLPARTIKLHQAGLVFHFELEPAYCPVDCRTSLSIPRANIPTSYLRTSASIFTIALRCCTSSVVSCKRIAPVRIEEWPIIAGAMLFKAAVLAACAVTSAIALP